MKLLGTPLLVLLCVLAIGLPVLALCGWSRVRGRHGLRGLQRVVMLIAAQLAAVLAVSVALNDYGDFYNSWGSLFSGQPHAAAIRAIGGERSGLHHRHVPPAAGRLSRTTDSGYSVRRNWASRGRIDSVEIVGANSRLREHAYVYLPPQYFQARYAHARFVAIEVLASYGTNSATLLDGSGSMAYPAALLSEIGQRRVQPAVLVMLSASIGAPRDTECTDVPRGPQAQTFYAADVPEQVSREYRVRAVGWGAIGAGSGGYCSAKLAMLDPDVFYAAVASNGYFTAIENAQTGDLWAGSTVLRNSNDLQWRLRHLPAPPVSVMVDAGYGRQSVNGYRASERFAARVTAPMTVSKTIYPGPNGPAAWRGRVPGELEWLCAHLPGGR